MKKRLFAVFAITLLCTTLAYAQDTPKVQRITLQEALEHCRQHNRMLQNASLEVRKNEAARWEAIASMLPQVHTSFDYSNFLGYEMHFSRGISIPMNPSGTFAIRASLTLTAQQIMGAIMQDLAVDMANVNAKKDEQTLLASTQYTYISLLTIQETITLLRQNLSNIQNLQNISVRAVELGVSEATESDKIAVQAASMQSTINQLERSEEMLYNSLSLLLGAGIDTRYEPSQTLNELLDADNALELLHADLDLNKNYDYQLLTHSLKLAKQQVTLAALAYAPTVSAYYQYSAKTYFGKDEGMNMTPPNMVGFTVSMPLFTSGQKGAAIQKNKLALMANENTMADTRDNLLMQDRQLRYNLSSAYENYQIQHSNVNVSKRVFQNMSEKYKQGYASSLEVTNASIELITAQNNYIKAVLEMVKAQLELRKLLNKFN